MIDTSKLDDLDEQIMLLTEAGMTAAAAKLVEQRTLARKLAIAYEHYRYVKKETIEAFRAELRKTTTRKPTKDEAYDFGGGVYVSEVREVADDLVIVSIDRYPGVPPTDVLLKVKQARDLEIFDGFAVASINPVATKVVHPDPIIFGHITGCSDSFFIAEWGTDVSINDLLGAHEG